MSKPRCFVLDECRKDLESAKEFGEITFLFGDHKGRSSVWGPDYEQDVLKALNVCRFNPNVDYLVAAGHQLNIVRAAVALVQAHGRAPMLFFYGPEQKYRLVILGSNINISLGVLDASGSSPVVQNSQEVSQ